MDDIGVYCTSFPHDNKYDLAAEPNAIVIDWLILRHTYHRSSVKVWTIDQARKLRKHTVIQTATNKAKSIVSIAISQQ